MTNLLVSTTVAALALSLAAPAHAASGSWKFTVLHSFDASGPIGWSSSKLVEGSPGVFWGTSRQGGAQGFGTIYRVQPGSKPELMHDFSTSDNDGFSPEAGLLRVGDWLYGTTYSGGVNENGTIYRISTSGAAYQVVHHFDWQVDGASPLAELIQAADGKLYGTTSQEGPLTAGTIFRFDPASNAVDVLHAFEWDGDDPGPGGGTPMAPLVQHSNGQFYGTTWEGGNFGLGTVFKLTVTGSFQTLHHFSVDAVGAAAKGGLTESSTGVLVGAGDPGGVRVNRYGTLYTVTPVFRDAVQPFHSFTARSEGRNPQGELTRRSDGRLYGMTYSGLHDCGSIYSVGNDGKVGVTHGFAADGREGCNPIESLTTGQDGALYGTTSKGGRHGLGTIFRLRWIPAR